MTKIGYARVSTIDQDFDIQEKRLKAEGCIIVRAEKVSGASRDGRTELTTIIEFLREGDELVVTRLDRLGRDTRDVLNIVYECEQRRIRYRPRPPCLDTRRTRACNIDGARHGRANGATIYRRSLQWFETYP